MKIGLLTNYDLPSALALEYLAPILKQHNTRIFHTAKPSSGESEKLVALSTFEKAKLSKEGTIFTALQSEVLNDINGADYQQFADTRPDLIISIRHMSILKSPVIDLAKFGVVNLHSGLLPAYQGVMASYWAMKFNEAQLGTTLHFIEDSTIDTGAVIARSQSQTRFDQSYLWNVLNLYRAGCENICSVIERLNLNKPIASTPQTGPAAYFSFPDKHDLNICKTPLYNASDGLAEFL